MSETKNIEGWGPLVVGQKKHHFYRDGRALCGKWLIHPAVPERQYVKDDGAAQGSHDCVACFRKLEASRTTTPTESDTPT